MRRPGLAAGLALAGLPLAGVTCQPPPMTPTVGGFPTPASVGLPPGWTPRSVHRGDLHVTTPGRVLDGIEVHGSINVRAEDVTIRNSRIHGRIWNQFQPGPAGADGHQYRFTVTDSTIGEPNGSAAALTQHGAVGPGRYTALRNEVYGSDGFRMSEPPQGGATAVLVQDNFVRNQGDGHMHLDGAQGYFGGSGTVIRHNTFDSRGAGGNAAVFMADCTGSATVENNLMMGGAFTLRIHDDHGNPPPASSFDCGGGGDAGPWRIAGNRIVQGWWGYAPADTTNTECGARTMSWSGNRVVTIDGRYNVTSVGAEVRC